MFHAKILHQNLRHSTSWNPQISFYFSHCQLPTFDDCSPYSFNIRRCSLVAGLPELGLLSTDSQPSLKHLCHTLQMYCIHCIIPKSLLNHPNCKSKYDADSSLFSLSHSECNGWTVHMLSQWHLWAPLTSTVKSSLFTYAHSSPLSLADRLHLCFANHSHYINNGCTFSGQTLWV